MRKKEFGNEVGLLVRCRGKFFAVIYVTVTSPTFVRSSVEAFLIVHRIAVGVGVAVFKGKKRLFLGIERLWQIHEERVNGRIEGDMEENDEDEINDHQDQWADGCFDSKQSNQTDDGEVDSSCCLLESAWIDETLRVDIGIKHVQHVVTISQVDQVEANCCESQDQRCNHRVGYCYQDVSCATVVTMIS